MPQEATSEAYVPAQRPQTGQAARVPAPHVDPGGSSGVAGAAPEGPTASVGLIRGVTDRRTFVELRHRARRARSGPLSLSYVPAATAGPPRVAYAIGRPVGHAVSRNRLRRQLRSLMAEAASADPTLVPPGAYLVSVGPAARGLCYQELKVSVVRVLEAVARPASEGRRR